MPRWVQACVLIAAALGLCCFTYGYLIEPYWPAVTNVRIVSSKLPPGSRPVRVAHLSDLHSDPVPRLEETLPELIAAQRPDVIVFTGDTINSIAALPVAKRLLAHLSAIAPTYVVKGNWDAWHWLGVDLFGEMGVTELDGEARVVTFGGTSIRIAGLAVGSRRAVADALATGAPPLFTVFMHHYPDLVEEIAGPSVDLYCAGHTHGGQVALPGYGALLTLSKFGKKYEAGLYDVSGTRLYVNRGIGMEGGGAPRVRFWARPEITIYSIEPAAAR